MECDVLLEQRRRKEDKEKQRTHNVWLSLKRSLPCKSQPGEVHEPKARSHPCSVLTRKTCRSGCSRSIANLKDVIHGGKRHLERPSSYSPRSIGSSEFFNPIAHEVIFNDSKGELRITGFNGCSDGEDGVGSSYRGVGSLSPLAWKSVSRFNGDSNLTGFAGRVHVGYRERASLESNAAMDGCHRCGEQFGKLEGLEAHHLSKHAVTELVEGDSSRKIVEIICRTSWLKSQSNCLRIEKILKVHNMQKTHALFEEYRDFVKFKASKLQKKHPRCLADGNELLRFHGTTVACNLGMKGSSSLCVTKKCTVCQIIRHGFSTKKELRLGVFTTSTSATALKSIEIHDDHSVKKALLICRVIAGRVHKPLENFHELPGQSGFDSLAGKVGIYSNIEELYLLNPRALLPCFVVICKS